MKTETWPVPSASSAPSMTGTLNRPKLSVVIRPTVNERPASRAWASVFGAKPSRWAASATRSRFSARSLPCPLSALEAVPMDTPASAATSRMVTRLIWYSSALAVDDPPSQPLAYGFVVPRENLFLLSGTGLSGTGPVVPTAAATGTHRPVTGTRLADGLLHQWQHRSLTASLPLALRQLEVAGNLDNVRLAVRTPDRAAADGHDGRPLPRNTVAPAPGSGYRGPV